MDKSKSTETHALSNKRALDYVQSSVGSCAKIPRWATIGSFSHCLNSADKVKEWLNVVGHAHHSTQPEHETHSIADALRQLQEEDIEATMASSNCISSYPQKQEEIDILGESSGKIQHACAFEPTRCLGLLRSNSFNRVRNVPIQLTVLRVKIQDFAVNCAVMSARRVGDWVVAFYELVDAAAAVHGITRVESRGDCCVCVCGAAGTAPPAAGAAAVLASEDGWEDQATRMLAFAADLNARVAELLISSENAASSTDPVSTAVRMGIATGEATFYVAGTCIGLLPFTSVTGAAAAAAARMEALAAPGEARVHRSTADKWAAETRQAPPATALLEGTEWAAERAAVFDCNARVFRPDAGELFTGPAPGPGPRPSRTAGGMSGRAGRGVSASASSLF